VLTITDDGVGFSEPSPDESGIGIRIMRHRASVVGASLDIRRGERGGTVVTCSLRQAR